AGSGNLYYVGGMRAAYDAATKRPHDHHLWLNDDTVLYPNAIASLLATERNLTSAGYPNAIVAERRATRRRGTRYPADSTSSGTACSCASSSLSPCRVHSRATPRRATACSFRGRCTKRSAI